MKIGKPFLVAEISANHCGDFKMAKKLIKCAKDNNADAVKLQTYNADTMTIKSNKKYFKIKNGLWKNYNLWDLYDKAHTPFEWHNKLFEYAKKLGIIIFSTPFDETAVDLLEKLKCPIYKISSFEMTDIPLIKKISRTNKPIIMSTGMATLNEVQAAMKILLEVGLEKDNLIIMHCVTEYPAPMDEVNLQAMLTIRDELGVRVGYSDHTRGIEISVAAVAMGATVIEKHFTLDRSLSGPDHAASLEPSELKAMISSIRNVEKAMGNGIKLPSKSEEKNILIARKSIVAKYPIKRGDIFTERNLTTKRPSTGISPMEWDNIIGKTSNYDFETDDIIAI